MADLSAEEEFAAIRDTPSIFRYAAVRYSSDPRAFLRGVQKTLGELAADEEFAAFRDTPGIFRQAAVYYPDDPRAFLRGCRRP